MSDLKKPFTCTIEGCDMSFTNEDHLTVHKKKHDMNLNLGSKSMVFVADETPTPTRFYRNCEEVGLFQDLQNLNPFEEQFKRATELVKSGNLPTTNTQASSDDSLHTPQVFPNITANNYSESTTNDNSIIEFDLKNPMKTEEDEKDTNVKKPTPEKAQSQKNSIKKNNKTTEKFIIKQVSAKEVTKQKIKDTIIKTDKNSNKPRQVISATNIGTVPFTQIIPKPIVINTPYILGANQGSSFAVFAPKVIQPTTICIPQSTTDNNLTSTKTSKNRSTKNTQSISEDELRRQTILDRNRAAQKRSRRKQKQRIANLVKQNEEFQKTQSVLNSELTKLRLEVARLQAVLAEHTNCDVTKAKATSCSENSQTSNIKTQTTTDNNLKRPTDLVTSTNTNNLLNKSQTQRIIDSLNPLKKSRTDASKTPFIMPAVAVNNIFIPTGSIISSAVPTIPLSTLTTAANLTNLFVKKDNNNKLMIDTTLNGKISQ